MYLAMGYTEEQFWESNPRKEKYYFEAYKLKHKVADEEMHRQGFYNFAAISTALGNAFRKKGSKAEQYMEKPLSATEMSNEEKEIATKNFFTKLQLMQANFELSKKSG